MAAHLRRTSRERAAKESFAAAPANSKPPRERKALAQGAGGNMKANGKKKQQTWRPEMIAEEIKATCQRMAIEVITGLSLVVTAYLAFGFLPVPAKRPGAPHREIH